MPIENEEIGFASEDVFIFDVTRRGSHTVVITIKRVPTLKAEEKQIEAFEM